MLEALLDIFFSIAQNSYKAVDFNQTCSLDDLDVDVIQLTMNIYLKHGFMQRHSG